MVAHPDDEVLFAYPALMARNCHVVCMTSGSNHERKEEYTNVMNLVNTSRNQKGLPACAFRNALLDLYKSQSASVNLCRNYYSENPKRKF
jgi:LmbE family N-acetylglucosaminyl deacetylase